MKNILPKNLEREKFLDQKSYLKAEVQGAPAQCFLQTYHVVTKSRGIDIWAETSDRYEFVGNMISTEPEALEALQHQKHENEKKWLNEKKVLKTLDREKLLGQNSYLEAEVKGASALFLTNLPGGHKKSRYQYLGQNN